MRSPAWRGLALAGVLLSLAPVGALPQPAYAGSSGVVADGTGSGGALQLVPGTPVTASLGAGETHSYTLTATAGTTYHFETRLGSLPDSILELKNSGGSTVKSNDDCYNDGANPPAPLGPNLESCIDWTAPDSGSYTVHVRGYSATHSGDYSLHTLGLTEQSCLARSANPYPANQAQTFSITNPDTAAASTRVHFSLFATEPGYDFVEVRDASNNVVERLHGQFQGGRWSRPVPGRTVNLRFTSDNIYQFSGFCADAVSSEALPNSATGMVFDPNPGSGFSDNNDADSPGLTSARVSRTLQALDGSGYLSGPFADVTGNGILPGYLPAGRAIIQDGVYNHTRSDKRFEEVMGYYHVDRAQRYLQSLGFTGLSGVNNRATPVHGHFDKACNAFYDSFDGGLHFGDCASGFTGVDAAEDGDVIVHEYGHAVLDALVPHIYTSEGGAIHEGFSDYLAATIFDNPCIAEWFAAGCLRTVQNSNRKPDNITGQVHNDGKVWSGALWEVRTALGKTGADRIIIEGLFGLLPSVDFHDAAQGIIAADRSLNNGSNEATLRSVFSTRGILAAPTVGPSSLSAEVQAGATATRPVTITNNGSEPLGFSVTDAARPPAGGALQPAAGSDLPAWGPGRGSKPAASTSGRGAVDTLAEVLTDPAGDQVGAGKPDLLSVRAAAGESSVTFRLGFNTGTDMSTVTAFVYLDTDQNPATGPAPSTHFGKPAQDIGFERLLHLTPGAVDVYTAAGGFIEAVAVTLSGQTAEFTVSLASFNDDGNMDVALVAGDLAAGTDWAPDSGHATIQGDVPWITSAPSSGSVTAGQQATVTVTFNAAGRAPGIYLANLLVHHDGGGAAGPTVIPVTMTVRGSPAITVTPSSGPAGTSTARITGGPFLAGETVAVHLDGTGQSATPCDLAGTRLGTTQAAGTGMIDVNVAIPSCAALGSHRVLAIGAETAMAFFAVTAPRRELTLAPGVSQTVAVTVHVPASEAGTVSGLRPVAGAGFETWLEPVTPHSGNRPANVTFNLTIRPPAATAPGGHAFQVDFTDGASSTIHGTQQFLVTVPSTTGSITVVKEVDPGTHVQVFDFSGSLGAFKLDDDGSGADNPIAGQHPKSRTFNNVFVGTRTVTETVPEGWTLSGVVCTGGPYTVSGATATIQLGEGEHVTCTFTASPPAPTLLLRLTPDPATMGLNGTVAAGIMVEMSGGQQVDGVEAVLTYDASLLDVVDADNAKDGVQVRLGTCELGSAATNLVTVSGNQGRIHLARGVLVAEGSTTGPAIAQACTLGIIDFRGKGTAAPSGSAVAFVPTTSGQLGTTAAYRGNRIELTTDDGLVRVVAKVLAFKKQPLRASQGFVFGTAPELEVRENGEPVSVSGLTVTLRLATDTGNPAATLTGCADDVQGTAGFQRTFNGSSVTFPGCVIDLRNGQGQPRYRLEAVATTATDVDGVVSGQFDVVWPGDTDDCNVDIVDFSKLLRSFGHRLETPPTPVDPLFDATTDFDGSNNTDIVDFSILLALFGTRCPTLSVSPVSGPGTTPVTLTGTNFGANAPVTLTLDGVVMKTVSASSTGELPATATFTIPAEAAPGRHVIKATAGRVSAGVTFTVPSPP